MKAGHSSLSRRLLFGAAIFIALALVVAGGFIGFALRRFITGQIDKRLDSQIVSVASAIEAGPRGQLQMKRDVDGPPFNRQESGWYWQVLGTNLKSRSLGAEYLAPDLKKERPDETRPFPADEAGPFDDPLHLRIQRRRVGASTVTIAVSAPRAALNAPLREAMTTLAISLGALGLALLLAIFLQVRLGLRPLNRLRADLADVVAGRIQRVPAEQPEEVQPVVAEMNTLLDQNAEGLARARRHVANLAHGLKTPLTTLSLALAEPGRDQDGSLRNLVTLMDRRIRHHLGRAKAAAQDGPARARAQVLKHVSDFGEAFPKIYAGKEVKFDVDVPTDLTVACEAQDLDEMLGNLLDNAFKWSRGNVKVSASEAGPDAVIAIQDDGTGLLDGELPEALLPGRRLDESVPGYGFGLPITRELAELYGGSLALSRSSLGGLKAELRLPRGSASSPSRMRMHDPMIGTYSSARESSREFSQDSSSVYGVILMLTWLQFGDLHASDSDGWGSLDIFSRLIEDANRHLIDAVDFAVLPGDNANHATPEQFGKIANAAARLRLPLHILPGDHDFESGSLNDFYDILGAKKLPHAVDAHGSRCLFLDVVSAGTGGPDFRVGDLQMQWLTNKLQAAETDEHRPLVFMHAYPNDLQSGGKEIEEMFSRSHVAFVGTGHTHYNELVNHQGVIYAATRSTGEVEEGSPGFSLGVLDGSVVSWHFKPIDAAWPLVLITSPSDHRLITDLTAIDQVPSGLIRVRAKVFGGTLKHVTARVDHGPHVEMTEDVPHIWSGTIPHVADGVRALQVEAMTDGGEVRRDTIQVLVRSGEAVDEDINHPQPRSFEPIGRWPERNLLGSQLGPNKNGRKW